MQDRCMHKQRQKLHMKVTISRVQTFGITIMTFLKGYHFHGVFASNSVFKLLQKLKGGRG